MRSDRLNPGFQKLLSSSATQQLPRDAWNVCSAPGCGNEEALSHECIYGLRRRPTGHGGGLCGFVEFGLKRPGCSPCWVQGIAEEPRKAPHALWTLAGSSPPVDDHASPSSGSQWVPFRAKSVSSPILLPRTSHPRENPGVVRWGWPFNCFRVVPSRI